MNTVGEQKAEDADSEINKKRGTRAVQLALPVHVPREGDRAS